MNKEVTQTVLDLLKHFHIEKQERAIKILERALAEPEWRSYTTDGPDYGRDGLIFIAKVKQSVNADENGLSNSFEFLEWKPWERRCEPDD